MLSAAHVRLAPQPRIPVHDMYTPSHLSTTLIKTVLATTACCHSYSLIQGFPPVQCTVVDMYESVTY